MIDLTGFTFCPACGKPSIEEHQKNGMQCRECRYVYFHNVASAVAGIIEVDGKVLLTVRAHEPAVGMLDMPGGFVDRGESAEEALLREIREELGIAVSVKHILGTFANRYEYRNVAYYTTDVVIICQRDDECIPITTNDEIRELVYFAPQEIPFDKIGFISNKNALKAYQQFTLQNR